ncbi:MAG TPA: hypothetical protein VLT59_16550 [Steroidobacteraceae bacterium]|nr:hypothetical protein [Steroidobacteraceae bacterium]
MTEERNAPAPGRIARLLRDVVVFQGKLLLDGARDALLIPVSLGAAAWDIFFGRDDEHGAFRSVLAWGRRTERFINLFDTVDGRPPPQRPHGTNDLDAIIATIESQLLDSSRRAALSESARAHLAAVVERLKAGRDVPKDPR